MFQFRTALGASCLIVLAVASGCGRVDDDSAVPPNAGGTGGTGVPVPRAGASNSGGSGEIEAGGQSGDAGVGGNLESPELGEGGAAGEAGAPSLGEAGGPGQFPACSEFETLCVLGTLEGGILDRECIDLRVDPFNCGDCLHVCPSRKCVDGSCVACDAGKTACGYSCVDTSSDRFNCGGCDEFCGASKVCAAGVCCAPASVCNGVCSDLANDPANCGGCGQSCELPGTCVKGQCGLHCDLEGLSECSSVCTDLQTDSKNCGYCRNDCGPERACSQGSCQCETGKTWFDGHCVDTQTDPQNCGSLAHACGYTEVCSNGNCGCRPGSTLCDGFCTDTRISQFHCGACYARCATGNVCTYGICEPPSSDWPTFGYDVARSGDNTVETGKPPLTFAWEEDHVRVRAPNYPVLSGGQLYVTHELGYGLYAFNVSDGVERWYVPFGMRPLRHGLPAVFSNTVYLVDFQAWPELANLWAIDTQGAIIWNTPLPDAPIDFGVPLRVGSTVLTNAGTHGGLYGFNASDGAQEFLQPLETAYGSWSPAYFSGRVYTFNAAQFRAHDPGTGAIQSQLDLSWAAGEQERAVPVFNASQAFVIAPPKLLAIDPALNAVAWIASDAYMGTPAVSGASVYAISGGNLVVNDASSGSLQWRFTGDAHLSYPPVIANGYVYVASDDNLYAVDISTHSAVDHKPIGGWLIVGSHRLIVAPKEKPITAYLLSK